MHGQLRQAVQQISTRNGRHQCACVADSQFTIVVREAQGGERLILAFIYHSRTQATQCADKCRYEHPPCEGCEGLFVRMQVGKVQHNLSSANTQARTMDYPCANYDAFMERQRCFVDTLHKVSRWKSTCQHECVNKSLFRTNPFLTDFAHSA